MEDAGSLQYLPGVGVTAVLEIGPFAPWSRGLACSVLLCSLQSGEAVAGWAREGGAPAETVPQRLSYNHLQGQRGRLLLLRGVVQAAAANQRHPAALFSTVIYYNNSMIATLNNIIGELQRKT